MNLEMQRAFIDFLRAEVRRPPDRAAPRDPALGATCPPCASSTPGCARTPPALPSPWRWRGPRWTSSFQSSGPSASVQKVPPGKALPKGERAAGAPGARHLRGTVRSSSASRRRPTGNAFYLEELIRAVGEGKEGALPETVLSMAQARLEGLTPARAACCGQRACSARVFWAGGVKALLGEVGSGRVDSLLASLMAEEVIVQRRAARLAGGADVVTVQRTESRFAGEDEYVFRHALLKEAAYAMLTEEDCVLGHRLAGEWLWGRGETDAVLLAEHFDRGSEPAARCAPLLESRRAGPTRGRLRDSDPARSARARQHGSWRPWPEGQHAARPARNDLPRVWPVEPNQQVRVPYSEQLLRATRPGSGPWLVGLLGKLVHALEGTSTEALDEVVHLFLSTEPDPEVVGQFCEVVSNFLFLLHMNGRLYRGQVLVDKLYAIRGRATTLDPSGQWNIYMAHSYQELWGNDNPWTSLQLAEATVTCLREHELFLSIYVPQVHIGLCSWLLGAHHRAERALREIDDPHGLVYSRSVSISPACWRIKASSTRPRRKRGSSSKTASPGVIDYARCADASRSRRCSGARGSLEEAEREAVAACELLGHRPFDWSHSKALHAAILLSQGHFPDALAAAEQALTRQKAIGSFGYKGSFVLLVHAEASSRPAITTPPARLSVARKIGCFPEPRGSSIRSSAAAFSRTCPSTHAPSRWQSNGASREAKTACLDGRGHRRHKDGAWPRAGRDDHALAVEGEELLPLESMTPVLGIAPPGAHVLQPVDVARDDLVLGTAGALGVLEQVLPEGVAVRLVSRIRMRL